MARSNHTSRTSRRLIAALALTASLVSASQAMAIPNNNNGDDPVIINDPPTAVLTATPNPVVIPPQLVLAPRQMAIPVTDITGISPLFGAAVSFSAAGSSDRPGLVGGTAPGTIVKYEWDLDGTPGFEKTTTTPTTSFRYSSPGVITARVRVTDNGGATDIASLSITAHRAPAARITPSKTVAVVGDGLTFTSASTDDNGIASLEWDLDGDGVFERTGAQVSTSFGTTGPHTVALRVTDILGAKSTASVTVRVHRAPTALIVTKPATPVVNQPTVLDGSRSTDDGSIAKYEWDLNGDGTFETNTAAVPNATTTFTATGPAKVGLRVTDNDGATDQTTLTLQVAATPVATIDSLAPRLRPLKTRLKMSATHRISFTVACPASEQICSVGVQVRGLKGALKGRSLGRTHIDIQGGRSTKATIALSKKAQLAIATHATKARVVLTATDASGNSAVTRTGVTIRK